MPRVNPFRHWLATLNIAVGAFVAGALAAPVLAAVGWQSAAGGLYAAYHFACHQWAFRSFFLFGPAPVGVYTQQQLADQALDPFGFIGNTDLGWKMAFCERDLAIYLSLLAMGLVYARHRDMRPAGFGLYGLLILPMAIDGFTQLLGWRESTWQLRVLTGLLFGLASGWLVLPRLDASFGLRPATTIELTPTASDDRQYSPGELCQPVPPVAEAEPRLSPRG